MKKVSLILISLLLSCTAEVNTPKTPLNMIPSNKVETKISSSSIPEPIIPVVTSTSISSPNAEPVKFEPILSVYPKQLILKKNEKSKIFAQMKISENEFDNEPVFIAKNENILSVDNQGNISALNEGRTDVYVFSKDRKYSKTIKVEIKNDVDPFIVRPENYSEDIPTELSNNYPDSGRKIYTNLLFNNLKSNFYSNYDLNHPIYNISGDFIEIKSSGSSETIIENGFY